MVCERVPTDSARKVFYATRANVVKTIIRCFDETIEVARDIESGIIYKEGHDSFENYQDVAAEYISARLDDRAPFQTPIVHSDALAADDDEREGKKVSDSELNDMFKVELGPDVIAGSKVMSRCPICRSTEIFSIAAQTRSADEGMSTLNRCERCGHNYKG